MLLLTPFYSNVRRATKAPQIKNKGDKRVPHEIYISKHFRPLKLTINHIFNHLQFNHQI